jgi:hypothetical protein
MPLEGEFEIFAIAPSNGCPVTTNLLRHASLAIPTRVLRFNVSGLRRHTPVRLVLLTGQSGPMLLHLRLRFFCLGLVDQPWNPVVFW